MECTFVAVALVLADLAMAAEGSQPSLKIVNSVVERTLKGILLLLACCTQEESV
jgi:hypothetical protein